VSSLSNFRERFDSRIHFSKLLRVGRSLGFLSLVRFKRGVVLLEHFGVSRLNILEGGEPPEIFEGSVDLSLGASKFTDLLSNLSIREGHLFNIRKFFEK
jgi:hypothetical protein